MKKDYVYITSPAWFEDTSLKNPIIATDHKLEAYDPDLYSVHYDTKLLITKAPSKEEKAAPFYNDYREIYGSNDIGILDKAISDSPSRFVFLNGFNQEQFLYIAPSIADTAEIMYFFKCPKIYDLSLLSGFKKLKCVLIYWNNSIQSLWDMSGNQQLKAISFTTISKLNDISSLSNSTVEYVSFDSSDNNERKKEMLFDKSVFEKMPHLKHLSLVYSDIKIDF